MATNRVKCKSGVEGWSCHLRENYSSFEEFEAYSETYGLAKRLGYKTAKAAWKKNPMIEGSTVPSDFRKSPKK